jgi:hypothetical protein
MKSTLTPQAARLVRLATLINKEQLPEAALSVSPTHVQVTAVHDPLVENTVRRWAAAVELPVEEYASEDAEGLACIGWRASGYDGTGCWWLIAGTTPVLAEVSA